MRSLAHIAIGSGEQEVRALGRHMGARLKGASNSRWSNAAIRALPMAPWVFRLQRKGPVPGVNRLGGQGSIIGPSVRPVVPGCCIVGVGVC